VDGLKAGEQWNLFYQAEFRKKQGDIEIKLYVAPPAPLRCRERYCSVSSVKNCSYALPTCWNRIRQGEEFRLGSGESFKLYRQFVAWEEQQDGSLSVNQLDDVKKRSKDAVERHTRALLGLGNIPAVSMRRWCASAS